TRASPTALGEALPCGLGREGCIASVFLDRVQEFANRSGISPHEVLGYAMAHELGHLLLGANSHSNRGLMQARLPNRDIQRGDLLFTPNETAAIAQRILARIKR